MLNNPGFWVPGVNRVRLSLQTEEVAAFGRWRPRPAAGGRRGRRRQDAELPPAGLVPGAVLALAGYGSLRRCPPIGANLAYDRTAAEQRWAAETSSVLVLRRRSSWRLDRCYVVGNNVCQAATSGRLLNPPWQSLEVAATRAKVASFTGYPSPASHGSCSTNPCARTARTLGSSRQQPPRSPSRRSAGSACSPPSPTTPGRS